MKSPCSPQPADGVAVADEAGNGLVALTVEDGLTLDGRDFWMVKRPDDCRVADSVADVVASKELLDREVRPLWELEVLLREAKLNGVETTDAGEGTAEVDELFNEARLYGVEMTDVGDSTVGFFES